MHISSYLPRWRKRIRLVKQSENTECGLACFVMVANFYGTSTTLAEARKDSPTLVRGASLKTLADLGTSYGFKTRGLQLQTNGLKGILLPAILHWQHNHFVVLEKIRGDRALIHDPNGYSRWLTLNDLDLEFTSFVLEITPIDTSFLKKRKKKPRIVTLIGHTRRVRGGLFYAFALTIILQISALAIPLFSQIAIDKTLPENKYSLLASLSVGLLIFLILNAILTLVRLNTISKIGSSFGESISSAIAKKLFRLPIAWFRARQSGEVLSRFHSIFPIKHVISDDLPALLVNVILAAVTSIMMFIYSPFLSVIGLIALVIYAAARAALLPRQKIALYDMMRRESAEHSFLLNSMQCMRSLRLSCREDIRQQHFQRLFNDYLNSDLMYRRIANIQKAVQSTLSGSVNVIVIWIAVTFAMAGRFTPGMIFACTAYVMQFLAAGIEAIDKYSNILELESHLDRLADISEERDDTAFETATAPGRELRGQIELIDVSYRYGDDEPMVLRSVFLSIEPGQSIAIAGPSGGGKSTLAQILLGLEKPTTGQVLVDGMPIYVFGYRNYYRQIAAVLQDEGLFHGSVQDNITLFDMDPDFTWLDKCVTASAIDYDISAWPLGIQTNVGDLGNAVSSGQRQRILLARALYSRPKLLVMDEGTAHLDAKTEHRVNESIKSLGITRIIFAHRPEAIAAADKVLILRFGQINEPGSDTGCISGDTTVQIQAVRTEV